MKLSLTFILCALAAVAHTAPNKRGGRINDLTRARRQEDQCEFIDLCDDSGDSTECDDACAGCEGPTGPYNYGECCGEGECCCEYDGQEPKK